METIKVLLVDDHPMVRRGLRSLLSSHHDIEVVGEAADGATALQLADEIAPHVIVLDILMSGAGGIEITQILRRDVPHIKIVILSAYAEDEYVFNALRAGAHAYLLKTHSDETIVDTVRQVYQGHRLLAPELMDRVLRQFQVVAAKDERAQYGLSKEELQVLELIARGETNEMIADHLYCSERTVKRRLEEIMSKLGAKTRAQAVAEAVKRGLI